MIKIFNDLRSKFIIKSFWFVLAVSLYFSFALNLSFWRFVIKTVEITNFGTAWFVFSLPFFVLAPIYIIFNAILTPYLAKPVSIILVLISSAANYFMYVYGVYIDSDMITNVFETTTREAVDLATFSSFAWIFFTGVIPAILIAAVKIEYGSFKTELKTRVAMSFVSVFVIGLFALSSFKEYAAYGRNNREVRKLLNTINYIYATIRYFQLKAESAREFICLDDNAAMCKYQDPHKTVLVVIVGETARAKNFSLDGYEKETNPLLAKQDVIYNKAIACGTATAVSLPCMFSHQPRANFNKNDAKYMENLIDIIAKSGYDVWWEDNDDGCKEVCNRVKTEHMTKTNNQKYCFGEYCHDGILIEALEDKLKSVDNDTVIVLHTMGSHGPSYHNRYPKEFKKFLPTCDTAEIQTCSKESVVNTYDNTILYTDYIISKAIDTLKKFPEFESGLIYISDHGESLGENNIYLHGLPYAIAPKEQIEVPMVIWMSDNMKKYDYIDYDCMKKEAKEKNFSHDNIFHSISSLLEINTTLYDKSYDIFQKCRTKELPY